ncbi:MAG: IPT/TIG domain-containing protein [Candidatus Marinimicrobia bacterium]|nr:IPT/TIG domain-containing protein [Candidatus Neomarinimicrobiota bacterium]
MRKPLIIFVLVALLIGIACDTEEPDSIFNPNATADPDPVITSITPPDSAYGGADERFTVTIVGDYFGDNPNEVQVNFGSKLAEIVSHSATQMVVTPPANFGDSLRIMVSKFGSNASWEFGTYEQSAGVFHPYKLLNPVQKINGFDAYTFPQSICTDSDGNVFVTHDKVVEKLSPDGTITTVGELRGKTTTRLNVGPDGALYYVYSTNIMKVDTSTFTTHTYKKLNANALDMDFDRNDNLYAIDNNSIYAVDKTTLDPTVLLSYNDESPDTNLFCIRVYDDDLYIAGTILDSTGLSNYIWKMALDVNAGTVSGNLEEVIDWSTTNYSDLTLTNFTFDVDGQMLVGTKNYALLAITPNSGDYASGTVKQVYRNIIGTEYIHRIYWGPDNYLYISTFNASNTENTKLLKVNMFGTGAPYYGRD